MDAAVGGFRRPRRVETDERDRDLAAVVANVPGAPALASRATVPVEVTCTLAHQLPQAVEIAAYYVVSESLTNMARHARATRGSVGLSCADETLIVQVADDGVGGADPGGGSGTARAARPDRRARWNDQRVQRGGARYNPERADPARVGR